LLVSLEAFDHRVKSIDQSFHLVAGLMFDGDLQVAEADFSRSGEKLFDRRNDHPAHGPGEQEGEADKEN